MISFYALTDSEKAVAVTMAYFYNMPMTLTEWKSIAQEVMPVTTFTKYFSQFSGQGYILKDSNFYSNYKSFKLHPALYLPALQTLCSSEFSSVYKVLKSFSRQHRYKNITDCTELHIRIITNNLKKVDVLNAKFELNKIRDEILYVFPDIHFENFTKSLSDSFIKENAEDFFFYYLVSDNRIAWDYIKSIILNSDKKRPIEIRHAFAFFYYMATGRLCIKLDNCKSTSYSLLICAILALYEGDYTAAYKLFTKVMTQRKKEMFYEQYVYQNPIINFYFTLSILLVHTEISTRKFNALMKKQIICEMPSLRALLLPLFSYFCKQEQASFSSSDLFYIFSIDSLRAIQFLVNKLADIFDIESTYITAFKEKNLQPRSAFLRTELEIKGDDESDVKLLSQHSLLSQLEIKPLWATKLENLLNFTQQGASAIDVEKQSFLLYFISYERIVPILKKRLKNGSWSVGKELSVREFKNLNVPCMTEQDINFAKHIDEWCYDIKLSTYIYDLVDCNHIFCGQRYDMIPVSIHEDKPYLVINKKKDNSFEVSSNIADNLSNDKITKCFIANSEVDYSVFKISSYEQKVYQSILSQKIYPADAESLLVKLIQSVGGKTEIHSNMVEGLDQIKKIKGRSLITIRIVPTNNVCFDLSFAVHPSESLSCFPGKGSVSMTLVKDEKRCLVVRSLKKEKQNLKSIEDKFSELDILNEDEVLSVKSIADTIALDIDKMLPFIEWANSNKDVCEMEWPEGAKIRYHSNVSASDFNIGFKTKNSWFEVEGDVKIDNNQILSLNNLLQLMHNSKQGKYIKVGENEYIKLSNDLSRILKRLDTATTESRSHLYMAPAAVSLVDNILDNADINISRNATMDKMLKRIKDTEKLQPVVPKALNAQLRNYQEQGFEWLTKITSWGAGACLADDMGLGKTLQTIAVLVDQAQNGASLVVAPASVVPNWRNEINRFAPTLNVIMLNTAADRPEVIEQAHNNDVVVTTYALLSNHQQELSGREWNVVTLDEAHTIKNPNTKMSKAAMTLRAERKIILTGTPIQNHLSELWNLFQFINPGLLGGADYFKSKYILPIEADHDKDRQSQLKKLITPFMLRRTKGEVIEELPEKNEIKIPVELSSDEMSMYELHRQKAEAMVQAEKNVKVSTLAEITKLRQMACSISLVDKKWKKMSSKLSAFVELAENLNESGNRTLVFSQFTSFFTEVRHIMDKAKLPYLYLDGSTPMKKRETLVEEFQKGNCPFFLISLKAGGLGLNLTGANYVIHLDPWWNPAIEQQATDRAYRIGQRNNVTVYHLISQHTIEEKIIRLHKTKRDLSESLLEGGNMSNALTQEELINLLKEF